MQPRMSSEQNTTTPQSRPWADSPASMTIDVVDAVVGAEDEVAVDWSSVPACRSDVEIAAIGPEDETDSGAAVGRAMLLV